MRIFKLKNLNLINIFSLNLTLCSNEVVLLCFGSARNSDQRSTYVCLSSYFLDKILLFWANFKSRPWDIVHCLSGPLKLCATWKSGP